MLKAILLDDEPNCVLLLALQLQEHCPQVDIIGQFSDSLEGLKAIRQLQPDLLFLDIEMPQLNGFALLEQLVDISFNLIFVTAYDEFAIKAFRYSAMDYLLKPIDTKDLKSAVAKAEKQHRIDLRQLEIFRSHYQSGQVPQKMAVPCRGGITFIELKDIVFCEADSNYTKLILSTGKNHLLTKTLREVQGYLEDRNFLRVHRQYLVNLDHIKNYVRGEGNYLVLTGDFNIPVGRNQKDRLLQRFGWI